MNRFWVFGLKLAFLTYFVGCFFKRVFVNEGRNALIFDGNLGEEYGSGLHPGWGTIDSSHSYIQITSLLYLRCRDLGVLVCTRSSKFVFFFFIVVFIILLYLYSCPTNTNTFQARTLKSKITLWFKTKPSSYLTSFNRCYKPISLLRATCI